MRVTRFILGAGIAAAAFLVAVPSAHAVSFGFDSDPAAGGVSGCGGGDVCGVSPFWTKSGLTVTATVFLPSPAGDFQIIQDLNPRNGGLGVVPVDASGNQDGDDDVDEREAIRLHFSVPVFLNTATFNDTDHNDLDQGNYLFSDDGIAFSDRSFGNTNFGGMLGTDFYFKWGTDFPLEGNPQDFYIESLSADPIPEPGTLLLMGMGLVGLAGRARKRLRG